MTDKQKRLAEQSLTYLGLSILADFVKTNHSGEAEQMKAGYLSAWALASMQDDSKRAVTFHLEKIKDVFGDNWREKLHEKVKSLIDIFDWDAYKQTVS